MFWSGRKRRLIADLRGKLVAECRSRQVRLALLLDEMSAVPDEASIVDLGEAYKLHGETTGLAIALMFLEGP